ncbi:MAG: hypothetical protein ABJV68_13455 [Paracoccaceae bacterium]
MNELCQDLTYETFPNKPQSQTLPWGEILAFVQGFVAATLLMILIVVAVPYLL